jgi:hypothetical protein
MALLLFSARVLATPASPHAYTPGGQTYQYFDSFISVMEGENFTSTTGWTPELWAHSPKTRFASTVANVFHSRRGFLHAPADGAHQVLVRYEAAYRFEVPFRVDVSQGGKVLASAVYGLRKTPKVWAFVSGRAPAADGRSPMCGAGLQGECRWPYGATENVVWEGTNVHATLAAGAATVTLVVDNSTLGVHPTASRNIDLVMLTPNASDVALRLTAEKIMLPLDGLLSQAGEVFARFRNYGATNLSMTLPYSYMHSPYFSMHLHRPLAPAGAEGCSRAGGPLCPTLLVPPAATSAWVEVGSLMDPFKESSWNLPAGSHRPPSTRRRMRA